jgi:hypothetical protein
LLSRFEMGFIAFASIVLAAFAAGNAILHARGYSLSGYVMMRDVAVIGIAGALAIGNLSAMRRNMRQGPLFLAVVCLLAIAAAVHTYRLIHGGLPCH